jgi:hypothetical protein
MSEKELVPVADPNQVPENMTEDEAREFWETHCFTEEYLEKAGPVPEGVLPPRRPPTVPAGLRRRADERNA